MSERPETMLHMHLNATPVRRELRMLKDPVNLASYYMAHGYDVTLSVMFNGEVRLKVMPVYEMPADIKAWAQRKIAKHYADRLNESDVMRRMGVAFERNQQAEGDET